MNDFSVQTDVFEGPFSALLELIEKHKLSINEVSLSSITDEYILHVKRLDSYSMNDISSFIVVAATLMLIKSRTLLPNISVSEEEKSEIHVLERRLEVFQIVKAIADYTRKEYGKKILFRRPFVRVKKKVFAPGSLLNTSILYDEIVAALHNIPRETVLPQTKVSRVVRIEEVLAGLMARVKREASFSFKSFAAAGTEGNKKEIKNFLVVSFLAMLELIKNGTLGAAQEDTYGDITISL
jgi:segregation and condensation protein A